LKSWVQKLVHQFDFDWGIGRTPSREDLDLSEERATLLFFIDTFNKHLIEIESHPTRAVREQLDGFAKEVIQADEKQIEKTLFKLRQFFGTYRIAEYSYIENTFNDFRRIIIDFIDQLGEDLSDEKKEDIEIKSRIDHLREAVEANSIDVLKKESREFIDTYVLIQAKKEKRRSRRTESVKKSLGTVKKQLDEAQNEMKYDHLTGAFNRRSFDDHVRNLIKNSEQPFKHHTIVSLDIDHFKKVNDCYGHEIGDFVLQECVKMLQGIFSRPNDFVARVGGEEFVVVMSDTKGDQVMKKAENALQKIRAEVFVKGNLRINFTVSMGVAERLPGEKMDAWVKRADRALYQSKNTGRNKVTLAPAVSLVEDAG
jgi:diguanylate cyclase